MWWVSRKEFDLYVSITNHNLQNLSDTVECARRLLERIAKLEASNNCRDGKHEWDKATDLRISVHGTITGNSNPYLSCKHCGVKKDELERQPNAETLSAMREVEELIGTDFPTLKKRIRKRQKWSAKEIKQFYKALDEKPKRKKGKK